MDIASARLYDYDNSVGGKIRVAELEVLHLSDLHWDSDRRADSLMVVNALVDDLRTSQAKGLFSPDFVVFSGDLVNSGEAFDQFSEAYAALIKPVLKTLSLPDNRFFIVPGNHDISRKTVRDTSYVQVGLKEQLKSVDIVNKFIDGLNMGSAANLPALERTSNYYKFIDGVTHDVHTSSPLLRTFLRDVRGLKVGIACFDTAWRTTGEPDDIDRGRLLLGERSVDQAIADLATADVRLAIMHHPLEWLADFDEIAVSSRLSANFDAMFCGHMHRALPQTRTTAQGTAILSQTGSVYNGRRWFNGYQVMKLHIAEADCEFIVRSWYDSPRRVFDTAVNVNTDGRVSFPYSAQKKTDEHAIVEGFLRNNRASIRQAASDQFNMLDSGTMPNVDVKETFIVPPLSIRIKKDGADNPGPSTDNHEDITAEAILRSSDSFIIAGGREAGKTSLLHYFAVLCAEGIVDKPRIPVIIDVETFKANRYHLKRAISSYYGSLPARFNLDNAIEQGSFLFLADNYTQGSSGSSALESQINSTTNNRWICISRPRLGSLIQHVEDMAPFKCFLRVRISPLPRRSIRALSRRWSPAIGSSDQDVFDAVMKQLKRDGLPRTGYMVTLILWAMQQEKELDRVNEAILLSNVADHLLGKADFTQAVHGRLDPRAKEITLEYLAEFVNEHNGHVTMNEATSFLSELFSRKRLPFISLDVMTELVRCGILDRQENGVKFKYKCFEEYFLALRMRSDPEVFSKAINPLNYRHYTREIELLSGLRRPNDDIINTISKDMVARAPTRMTSVQRSDFSSILAPSFGLKLNRKELSKLRRKRLTPDQMDDLLDVADRRATAQSGNTEDTKLNKEIGKSGSRGLNNAEPNLVSEAQDKMEVFEYLIASDLLARVVKNSDFSDFEVKAPALCLVLETMTKICLIFSIEFRELLQEASKSQDVSPLAETETQYLVCYLTKFVANVVSTQLSIQLSAPNVAPMICELFDDQSLSLIERMFLAHLLQGLRAPHWDNYWSKVLQEGSESSFIVESIVEKMEHIANTQYLDDKENEKLHAVIDTAEEVLGWAKSVKGNMLQNLKKAALQADFRDTV